MATVTLARHAMATRFEMVLHGDDPHALRGAGEAALDEIDRLECQLSLYRPSSEIAHLNAAAAHGPFRVSPSLFSLLAQAHRLSKETNGAFDITLGPLSRCWGFMHGPGHVPTTAELAEAQANVGMHLVQLDPENFTVQFAREGVMLDLGAIGKGYAIESAAEILSEAGVENGLIHGGTSTVQAFGHPPDSDCWTVALEKPKDLKSTTAPQILASIPLCNEAMSVSAVWGKSFVAEQSTFGHVLDARTGAPASSAVLAAVVLPSATESDALSTALLTVGPAGHDLIAELRPGIKTALATQLNGRFHFKTHGIHLDSVPC